MDQNQRDPIIWKGLIWGFLLPFFARVLMFWLAPAVAWAVAAFIWCAAFYYSPPHRERRVGAAKVRARMGCTRETSCLRTR